MTKRKRYWVCVDDGIRHPIALEQAVEARDFFSRRGEEEALILADGDPRLKKFKLFDDE